MAMTGLPVAAWKQLWEQQQAFTQGLGDAQMRQGQGGLFGGDPLGLLRQDALGGGLGSLGGLLAPGDFGPGLFGTNPFATGVGVVGIAGSADVAKSLETAFKPLVPRRKHTVFWSVVWKVAAGIAWGLFWWQYTAWLT